MEVPKEWVMEMLDGYYLAGVCASERFDYSPGQITGMSRAAERLAERCREKMLAEPTKEEWCSMTLERVDHMVARDGKCFASWDAVKYFLAHRRSLPLEGPKKTPEEKLSDILTDDSIGNTEKHLRIMELFGKMGMSGAGNTR